MLRVPTMRLCGDGITNGTEACDDAAANDDGYSLDAHCNATCSGAAPFCGDGIQNGPEACDDGDTLNNACSADCSENQVKDCAGAWGGSAA